MLVSAASCFYIISCGFISFAGLNVMACKIIALPHANWQFLFAFAFWSRDLLNAGICGWMISECHNLYCTSITGRRILCQVVVHFFLICSINNIPMFANCVWISNILVRRLFAWNWVLSTHLILKHQNAFAYVIMRLVMWCRRRRRIHCDNIDTWRRRGRMCNAVEWFAWRISATFDRERILSLFLFCTVL